MNNPTFKERAHAEILNFSYVALYLFICFAVLMFFESTLTDRANTGVFPSGPPPSRLGSSPSSF